MSKLLILLALLITSNDLYAQEPIKFKPALALGVGTDTSGLDYSLKMYTVQLGNDSDPVKANILGVGAMARTSDNSKLMIYSPIQININSIGFSLDFPFKENKNASMSLNFTMDF